MIFHVHVGNVNSVGFVGGCTPHRSHILRGCIGTISALARLRFHACILLLGRGLTKRSTCWQSRTFVPANAECCRARNASIHPLSSIVLTHLFHYYPAKRRSDHVSR